MKIISALGGGGSTFIMKVLRMRNYRLKLFNLDLNDLKINLTKRFTILEKPLNLIMGGFELFLPRLKVLQRPDSFWTEWALHKTGYNPNSENFLQDLSNHKEFIINSFKKRSAGLKISRSDLRDDSIPSLVRSYINTIEKIERKKLYRIILLAGHWGEYGIFKDLGVETVYIIRDPYNSIISHSKPNRHEKDYLRRGLKHINTKEWIDSYLKGPHHYWINHAETALSHKKGIIVRYDYFTEDWKKIKGLPDISSEFSYKENNVARILTKESINYIYEQTHEICKKLGLKEPNIF